MAIEAQVALVHGGGIRPVDGGYALRPGSVARAHEAIGLYQSGAVEGLLFSGGNAHGHDFAQSEASMMADLAVQADIPADHIECEETSTSTIGNWANSLSILEHAGVETVFGVTGRIATRRADWIGHEIIDYYRIPVSITGYRASDEAEGLRAYPREVASRWMAHQCLKTAERQEVLIGQLDAFYLGWKSRTGLAHAKARLTRR